MFPLPLHSILFLRDSLLASSSRYAVFKVHLVGSSGLEPPTSRLSGARSNHLSYEPSFALSLVEMMGFEPMTPCLQGRCSPN